jgi:hypothetical protein
VGELEEDQHIGRALLVVVEDGLESQGHVEVGRLEDSACKHIVRWQLVAHRGVEQLEQD